MGNGAIVSTDARSLTRKEFEVVERLCRNCHFHDNYNDYKTSVQKAIDNDAIDMLEILIPAGNAKKLQPLHIACRLAKLESAELLLSAGFSCLLQDGDGRTPLHLCSISRSLNAGLCATLLTLSGQKALTVRDSTGLTPLHLAAAQNNLHVIEALMNNGADITITTSAGKTPYQIAMDNKNYEALNLLKQLVSNNSKGKSTSKRAITNSSSSASSGKGRNSTTAAPKKQQSPAEYDRIMAVWEKFFENAFKRLGMDPDELDNDTDQYTSACLNNANSVKANTKSKAKAQSSSSSSSYNTKAQNYYNSGGKSSSPIKAYANEYSRNTKYDNWTSDAKQSSRDTYASNYGYDYDYKSDATSSRYTSSSKEKQVNRYDHDQFEVSDYSSKTVASSSKHNRSEYAYTAAANESYRGSLVTTDDYVRSFDWFQWVVCYSEEAAQQADCDEAYYVLNKETGESVWLCEHIDRFLRSTLLPCEDWSDFELHMRLPLPTTLRETVARGWLTYYERAENTCKWINLPTKSVEAHLPLGLGEDSMELAELNLAPCDSDTLWYSADQTCAAAWVLVVGSGRANCNSDDTDTLQDDTQDDNSAVYYYRNRITGETSWDAPIDWDKLLSSWGYWTLCCNEDSCDDLYWYDFDTGESAWVEK